MKINKLYEEKEARNKLETENATNLLLGIGKRRQHESPTKSKQKLRRNKKHRSNRSQKASQHSTRKFKTTNNKQNKSSSNGTTSIATKTTLN